MFIKHKDKIFHQLMHTSKIVAHKTHGELEKVGLYRGQPVILYALWDKDCLSRRELCQLVDRTPATVTKMVKRMEQNEFLTSVPDKEDSRISRVCLTQKSKDIEKEVNEIYEDLYTRTFKGFSDEEKKDFSNYLDRIKENLGYGLEVEKGENHG